MQGPGEMEEAAAIDLSKQMAVMSSEFKGLRGDVTEIKANVQKLSDAAPVHRISEMEKWRDDVKDDVHAIPELRRWKTSTNKVITSLAVGLIASVASAVLAWIFAR